MELTNTYQLRPTRRQYRALDSILEQQRQLYNAALAERIDAYQKTSMHHEEVRVYKQQLAFFKKTAFASIRKARKSGKLLDRDDAIVKFLSYRKFRTENSAHFDFHRSRAAFISIYEQSKSLTQIRQSDPAFAVVQRRIQRETLNRLDLAYKAFFRRVAGGEEPGFPKFKGKEYFDGFGFDAFQQVKIKGNRLKFAGSAGGIRIHLDNGRKIDGLKIKGIRFKRVNRRWYIGLQCEVQADAPRTKGKAIGVDWGTSNLAVLSSGEEIPNLRFGEALQERVAVAQRVVARRKKGSKRRMKARRVLQALNRKLRNKRKNYNNKVSKRLATQYRFIATEKTHFQAMVSKRSPEVPAVVAVRRNREDHDVASYQLRQMIDYKATRYGAEHYASVAKNSTQICCRCGALNRTELTDKFYDCEKCGSHLPRKQNAAINHLNGALAAKNTAGPGREGATPGNTGERRKARAFGRRATALHHNTRINTVTGRPHPPD